MKSRRETGQGFTGYYLNQVGNGMPIYSGSAMQRGHGLGNISRRLLRVATPLIKNMGKQALRKSAPILKEVGKHALERGLDEMTDSKRPKMIRLAGEAVRAVTTTPRKQKKAPRRQQGRRGVQKRSAARDIFS